MQSKALTWARRRDLNCEQDLMAESLRVAYIANIYRAVQIILLTGILVSMILSRMS